MWCVRMCVCVSKHGMREHSRNVRARLYSSTRMLQLPKGGQLLMVTHL